MLSLSAEKIDGFFKAVAASKNLYIPVDNTSGKANFQKWSEGTKLSSQLKTVRSAKDFFFPKTENLVNYKIDGKSVTVEDPRKDVEDFVVFGVRACDAKSFEIIDNVYLKMTPVDSYYKNRRDHGTVVTLACSEPAQTCFCPTYKIDAANPAGDVSAWLADGTYYFLANTDKGKSLLESVKSVLSEADEKAVDAEKKAISEKLEKLPFAHLDLSKFDGKNMMKVFNSKVWDRVSEACLGCGTCTYVCPTCMCFDVRDFDTGNGIKQVRCWDSCMYNDFTQMAAENPRHTQKERSRQRFMHKLVYYPMAHDGLCSCVGCGRCLESCPVNMNIVKVIKAFNEEAAEEK
ncbi:4Fe-4S dicluster domain-containing protein [Treponema peruense]|uniref:4Fe-4S dicluster domain-containing protein n=1 Tax=Treponema peruense TaxID=2787628 RepID=A0A7T3RF08_9SPIR|nr:4Fe-4S dicluster domain-containing protein [Treponema peruense]QQA01943.1 4Fe-4S dicluster domain-containing protein [Treponema peruense]